MLDPAITADLVLVSPRVEEAYVKRLITSVCFRKKDLVDMFFRVVIIVAVAGDPAKNDPLIVLLPLIDRQDQEF